MLTNPEIQKINDQINDYLSSPEWEQELLRTIRETRDLAKKIQQAQRIKPEIWNTPMTI